MRFLSKKFPQAPLLKPSLPLPLPQLHPLLLQHLLLLPHPLTEPRLLPGTVLRVNVSAGATVKKGDVLCVLEAMKMENDIPAPVDGVIKSVNVNNGATVNANDLLFVIG